MQVKIKKLVDILLIEKKSSYISKVLRNYIYIFNYIIFYRNTIYFIHFLIRQ